MILSVNFIIVVLHWDKNWERGKGPRLYPLDVKKTMVLGTSTWDGMKSSKKGTTKSLDRI